MDIHAIHGPRKPQFGLEMLFFGPHGIHDFPDGPIYAEKTSILESNRSLSPVFWTFFDLGRAMAWARPVQNWAEAHFGRRGKLTMSSNRRVFQAQLPSQTLPEPPGDPQRPSQEGFKNNSIFFKKQKVARSAALQLARRHPWPLRGGGGGGDGSQCCYRVLMTSVYTFLTTTGGGFMMTSSCLVALVSCIGTHVVGPLPDFWASGKPVGLGNGISWNLGG